MNIKDILVLLGFEGVEGVWGNKMPTTCSHGRKNEIKKIRREDFLKHTKTMKEITISIPDGKRAEWVNGVLTLVDEKPMDVTERIKTFEDAVEELGEEDPLVYEYSDYTVRCGGKSKDLRAYMKLRIICAALNEGWEPEFSEGEYRYYPHFFLYTDKKLSETSDRWKQDHRLISIDSYNVKGYSGLGRAASGYVLSSADASFGARLCLKSDALATYCGKQFIDLWADYYLIRNIE